MSRVLLDEAVTAVRTGRWMSALLVVLSAALMIGVVHSEWAVARRAVEADAEFRRAGGHLFLYESADEDAPVVIPRGSCESLSELGIVEASGSVGEPVASLVASHSDRSLELFPVTVGMLSVLDSIEQPTGTGVVTTATVMDSLKLSTSETISLRTNDDVQVLDVVRTDLARLKPGFDSAGFVVAPPLGYATTCIVSFRSPTDAGAASLTAALGSEVIARRVLVGSDLAARGRDIWGGRPTGALWLVSGFVYLLAAAGVSWSRRSESGLLAAMGLSHSEVALVRFLEFSIASLLGALVAIPVCLVLTWSGPDIARLSGATAGLLSLPSQFLAGWLVGVIALRSNPLAQIKDRA